MKRRVVKPKRRRVRAVAVAGKVGAVGYSVYCGYSARAPRSLETSDVRAAADFVVSGLNGGALVTLQVDGETTVVEGTCVEDFGTFLDAATPVQVVVPYSDEEVPEVELEAEVES